MVRETPGRSSATGPPLVLIVTVVVIDPSAGVTVAGLKLQAASTGNFPQEKVPGCVKPALGVTVMVVPALCPAETGS